MLLALTLFAAVSPLPAQEDPPHIVFLTGDEEYRSEESMPMLAGLLEHQYGFRCTVLYAQDHHGYIAPNKLDNIPGLEVLADADLLVQFTRFRALPEDQLQHILDYAQSGKPMVGFRTTTHAFLYPKDSPLARWNDGFGREFFGQKWITHHGHQSTTGVTVVEEQRGHPILRGVEPFFAASWLYHVQGGGDTLPDDATVLATGSALKSHYLDRKDGRFPLMQPVAWTRLREGKQRIFFTTLGHPQDFTWASMRRLSVNGILWALGMEEEIPEQGGETVLRRPYVPTEAAYGGAIPGRRAEGLPESWEPGPGASIAFVGNTMAERLSLYGNLETMLQVTFPDQDLSVRNLGWSADTPTLRPRPASYPKLNEQLDSIGADNVFAFFGFNESFLGYAGLDPFRTELEQFVREVRQRRFADGSYPEIVLIPPMYPENHGNASFDAGALAEQIQPYVEVMREVAARTQVRMINTYYDEGFDLDGNGVAEDLRLTTNGIHLNARGDRNMATRIVSELSDCWVEEDDRYQAVREAVVEKERHWYYRYRAVNGAYIYGGRKDPFGSVSFPQEMDNLDLLVRAFDMRIHALADAADPQAVGQVDVAGLPELPLISTNFTKDITVLPVPEAEAAVSTAEGYRASVFADSADFPDLQNPVALTFDGKGRLWVSVMPTYPQVVPGQAPNCKLLILEDTDGDQRADRQTIFADGLYLPTGFELGDGGAYVGQQPNLVFLEDLDGDDRADRKEIVLHGFGTEDSHHSISAFTWGPGGGLYMQEGTFHHSQVETPFGPVRLVDGGVFRWEPHTGRLRVHTPYGFWNPWGHVFDDWGQDYIGDASDGANYLAAPMTTDKEYARYRRGMPSFTKATVRPTGGSELVTGHLFPQSVQGDYLVTNTIGFQGIRAHRIAEEGSGVVADQHWDLLSSSDPNFRPIDLQFGPDGALYFVDWFNPLIGHMQHSMRDPNRDHEHGRIWRVSYHGEEAAPPRDPITEALAMGDLSGYSTDQLISLLTDSDARLRYRVRRSLRGHEANQVAQALDARSPEGPRTVLEHFWVRQQHGLLTPEAIEATFLNQDPRVRAAVVRAMSLENGNGALADAVSYIMVAAARDEHPRVRLEAVAMATRYPHGLSVETVLDVAQLPTDPTLDYAIDQALQFLRPQWIARLQGPWFYAEQYPDALTPILSKADTATQLTFHPIPSVARQILLSMLATGEQRRDAVDMWLGTSGNPPSDADALLGLIGYLLELDAMTLDSDLRFVELLPHFTLASKRAHSAALESLALHAQRKDTRLFGMTGWMAALEDGAAAPLVPRTAPDELWQRCIQETETMELALEAARLLGPSGAMARASYLNHLLVAPTSWPGCPAEEDAHVTGRYVQVQLPGRGPLTLAEVEIWSDGRNIALHGTATQDSVAWGGSAERALDGNHDGAWGSGTQTHTEEGGWLPWWEVDLGGAFTIDQVVVWNRTDETLGNRLEGYTIKVFDHGHRLVWASEGNPAPTPSAAHSMKVHWPSRIRHAALRALAAGGSLPLNPLFADDVTRVLERTEMEQRHAAWFQDGITLLERMNRLDRAAALRLWEIEVVSSGAGERSPEGRVTLPPHAPVAMTYRNTSDRWQAVALIEASRLELLLADEPAARLAESPLLQQGETVFQMHCLSCHGSAGQGLVGPNMTDDHFLHLQEPDQIHALIRDGILERGMTPFKEVLSPQQIDAVAAYMLQLRGTTPEGQKEAQGELIPLWESPDQRLLRLKRQAGLGSLERLVYEATPALQPGGTTTLFFAAPESTGDYLLVEILPGTVRINREVRVEPTPSSR